MLDLLPLSPAAPAQDPLAQLLEPSPVPGDPWSLPSLRDVVAVFLTAASTSSKAARVPETHTRTQRTLTGQVTEAATDKVLPSTAPTRRAHKTQASQPSSSSAGRDRRSVVQAGTQQSLDSQAHTYSLFPQVPAQHSVHPAPTPPTCQIIQLDAH